MSARIVTWSALATLICATTLGPGYAEEATAPQAQSPHLLSAATSEEQAQAHAPQVAPAASYQPQAHENQAPTEIAANLAAQPTAPSAPAPEQAAQTVPAQADVAKLPAGSEAQTGAESQTGAEAQTGAESQTGAEAQTGAESQTGAEAQTGAESQTGAEAQTGAESQTGAEAQTGTKSQAGVELPAGAEALADAEMPAGAEPQAASEPTAAAAATLAQGKSFDDTIASFSSEERPKRSGPLAENNLSTAGGIIKWLLSTIAILGVIVLFAFLLKKSRLVQRSVGPMRLEAQMAVGPKERVVQLQVGERHILLGVTANSVNFLMDLTESEAPAEPEAQVATPKPTTAYTREEFDRFAAQFMAYMQENRASASAAAGAAAGSAASSAAFSEVFAQAYDRTTQTAQEAGLMGAQLAPEPAQVSPAGAQATPAADAPNAKDELSQAPVDGAQVLAALKNTPWVADTELAPDDSENLPPLPEGLSKGTTPEEVPAENAKEQRVDGK